MKVRVLAVLVAAALLAACGVTPLPTPATPALSATPSPSPASPSPVPTKPYHLALGAQDRVIRSATDCAFLPSAWLRDFCALTLRADWHSVATDGDPRFRSASWYGAMSRAEMDGDLSICDDVRMRTWLSLPTMGGPPGATPAPRVGPIAECRHALTKPPRPGSITIEDRSAPLTEPVSVTLKFQAPTIDPLPPPSFDPSVICAFSGEFPMSATTCSLILAAVQASAELNAASITVVGVRPSLLLCAPLAACDEPAEAAPLGSAVVGYGGDRVAYVNAWATNGTVVLTRSDPETP